MPLSQSRLPGSFKICTTPLIAWIAAGLTLLWPAQDDVVRTALEMIRGSLLLVAILGTLYLPIALLILRKVNHAK